MEYLFFNDLGTMSFRLCSGRFVTLSPHHYMQLMLSHEARLYLYLARLLGKLSKISPISIHLDVRAVALVVERFPFGTSLLIA